MKVLCLFLLCALPSVAFSCSCSLLSFSRPRTQAIKDVFCSEYSSSDVYTARVVGATCNCIPASGDANLQCLDYTFTTDNTSVVNVEVVNRILESVQCDTYRYAEVSQCSGLTTSLAGSGNVTVENVTTNLPPVVNRTDSGCFYSCPFNNRSSSQRLGVATGQPCVYTLKVTRVFKGNYTRGKTLVVPGPDVLTSCGDPGRLLRLREEYVVGIGGFCNPISDWSTVSSYSSSELNLLTELASGCKGPLSSGAIAGVVLGGLVFLIVLAVIAACVCVLVYGYLHPTSKIGLFMIEHRPKAKSLNEKSSYNVESGKTAIDEKE